MADKVGVVRPAWTQYESGARRIHLDPALRLCNATGVSLDWIYRGDVMRPADQWAQFGALPPGASK